MMEKGRAWPLALWAFGVAVLVGIGSGSAFAEPVLLGQVHFNHSGALCTSESVGGTLPSFVVVFGIGHGLASIANSVGSNAGFGFQEKGSRDFNDSSPRFAQLVQSITNGSDEDLFTLVTLQIPNSSVGVSSTRRESEFPELDGRPDLAGSAVSFVRLVVTNSVVAAEQCQPPQLGARIFVAGRWEFWGTPSSFPPTVALSPLGCTTCRVGDFAQFKLVITNPGPARTVEVKVASRFPDGVTLFSILDPSSQRSLGAGQVLEETLPGIILPGGLPFGTYILEAALLEPQLGESLARTTFPAQLVP